MTLYAYLQDRNEEITIPRSCITYGNNRRPFLMIVLLDLSLYSTVTGR